MVIHVRQAALSAIVRQIWPTTRFAGHLRLRQRSAGKHTASPRVLVRRRSRGNRGHGIAGLCRQDDLRRQLGGLSSLGRSARSHRPRSRLPAGRRRPPSRFPSGQPRRVPRHFQQHQRAQLRIGAASGVVSLRQQRPRFWICRLTTSPARSSWAHSSPVSYSIGQSGRACPGRRSTGTSSNRWRYRVRARVPTTWTCKGYFFPASTSPVSGFGAHDYASDRTPRRPVVHAQTWEYKVIRP